MPKVDFGKLTINPGYRSMTGLSLAFVGGKDQTTSGAVKDGIRIADNYGAVFGILDTLRKGIDESRPDLSMPDEWYLTLPDFGATRYTPRINIGRGPTRFDMRTNNFYNYGNIGSILIGLSIENTDDGLCLGYGDHDARIVNLPDLGDCSINHFVKKHERPKLMLFADRYTPTEKFGEAMKIYLSMLFGDGKVRDFEGEKTELFGVLRGTQREKMQLSKLIGQDLPEV